MSSIFALRSSNRAWMMSRLSLPVSFEAGFSSRFQATTYQMAPQDMPQMGSLIQRIVRLGIYGFNTLTELWSVGCLRSFSRSRKRASTPMQSTASSGLIDNLELAAKYLI